MKITQRRDKYINKHSQIGDIVKFSYSELQIQYELKIEEEESCLYCFFYTRVCPSQSYCKHFSREDKKNIVYKRVY